MGPFEENVVGIEGATLGCFFSEVLCACMLICKQR